MMPEKGQWDVIVVGSGPCGVNAAVPLVAAGLRVMLLDVGNRDEVYAPLIPAVPFREIRETDSTQHRFLLGERFEGIPLEQDRVGAHLTPPREHVRADTDRLLPYRSETFELMESLALGGLGAAWGAGAFPFLNRDLQGIPVGEEELRPHYQRVAERIGVAAAQDDLTPFLGGVEDALPAPEIDENAQSVLETYQRNRRRFHRRGWYMGRTHLAISTVRHRERGPLAYRDMEFWTDCDRSVYRPRWTLEELIREDNFVYQPSRLVERFFERGPGAVMVEARDPETGTGHSYHARALVLAAGTTGSCRIVLRSLKLYDRPVPILCNPYTYIPVLNLRMLGRVDSDRRHSLAQLTAFLTERRSGAVRTQVQYYTYRSLLIFKLLKEVPLAYSDAREILRRMLPLIGIAAVNHDDEPSASKYCVLRSGEELEHDTLEIEYQASPEEKRRHRRAERRVMRNLLSLGLVPLRAIRLPPGSSIHYAGTIPMGPGRDEVTVDPRGRLSGTEAVYVADGSVLRYLPPKGLTFTIMALADRLGTLLARDLCSTRAPAAGP